MFGERSINLYRYQGIYALDYCEILLLREAQHGMVASQMANKNFDCGISSVSSRLLNELQLKIEYLGCINKNVIFAFDTLE